MAPELLQHNIFTEKGDVYAYGMIVFEVLTGDTPWSGLNQMQIMMQVCIQKDRPKIDGDAPADLVALMRRCGAKACGVPIIDPVGVSLAEPISTVRVGSPAESEAELAAPSRSKAMMTSAPSSPLRFDGAGASVVIRRSPLTRPAFCERPVWSSPRTCRPSSIAAVATIWATVTTPVPPIPTIRRSSEPGWTMRSGSGRSPMTAPEPSRGLEGELICLRDSFLHEGKSYRRA